MEWVPLLGAPGNGERCEREQHQPLPPEAALKHVEFPWYLFPILLVFILSSLVCKMGELLHCTKMAETVPTRSWALRLLVTGLQQAGAGILPGCCTLRLWSCASWGGMRRAVCKPGPGKWGLERPLPHHYCLISWQVNWDCISAQGTLASGNAPAWSDSLMLRYLPAALPACPCQLALPESGASHPKPPRGVWPGAGSVLRWARFIQRNQTK